MYCSLGNKVYKLHFDFLVSLLFTMVCWCVGRICLFEVLLTVLQNHFLWSTLLKLVFWNHFYTIPILLPLQKVLLAWGFFFFFQSCCQGADCFWLLNSKPPENELFKLKSISHEHGRFSSHLTCLFYLVTQLLCDGDCKIIWAGCIDNVGRKIILPLEILECQS